MDLTNFSLMDGVQLSIFAMLVVFIILMLLQVVIYAFKFLPKEEQVKTPVAQPLQYQQNLDEEDEMVAMLTAAALAKEDYKGNVRIKSIKRIG